MSEIPNIPQGKKVLERTTSSGDKEYVVRNDPNYGGPDCWLATAYYGDSLHPDVVLLRRWRESSLTGSPMDMWGFIMPAVNSVYLRLGRTALGLWWAQHLRNPASPVGNICRLSSKGILRCLLMIARP